MTRKPPPAAAMFTLIAGRWVSHLLYIVAKLELADRIGQGSRTTEELSAAAGVQAPALYRVLRTLASFGVFEETRGRRFKLTPLAATLQKSAPNSMHALALLMEQPYLHEAWGQMLNGLTTGENSFLKAHGVPLFEYLDRHPETVKIFSEAMASVSSSENPAIAAAYKFSGIRTIVDVGGGNGSLLGALLKATPKLKGVHFDRPSVSALARQGGHLTAKGVAGRCTFESGDFFESVPQGGDAYIMKRVIHDWDDGQCAKILSNCRSAMNNKGRVLVLETVIPPGNGPDRGKLLDIQMLVIGGRERTKQEFSTLFKEAGLKLTRIIPTKCPLSIVEGVRA
jgi:O-methyltransferase domain